MNLFCIEVDEDTNPIYVAAVNLREALRRYKETAALCATAENRMMGLDEVVTVDEIFDPLSVSLVAFEDDCIF